MNKEREDVIEIPAGYYAYGDIGRHLSWYDLEEVYHGGSGEISKTIDDRFYCAFLLDVDEKEEVFVSGTNEDEDTIITPSYRCFGVLNVGVQIAEGYRDVIPFVLNEPARLIKVNEKKITLQWELHGNWESDIIVRKKPKKGKS